MFKPDEFRKVIEKSDLGISELSRRTGLSRTTIYKLLDNKGNPTEQTLRALIQVLNDSSFFDLSAS